FVMDANGDRLQRLTTTPKVGELDAAWSPSGRRIAFVRSSFACCRYRPHIWVMSANGSQQRQLTHGYAERMPVWSPNGRRIAYVSSPDEESADTSRGRLMVMGANGSEKKVLLGGVYEAGRLSWASNGDTIAFTDVLLDVETTNGRGARPRKVASGIAGALSPS